MMGNDMFGFFFFKLFLKIIFEKHKEYYFGVM